MIGEALELRRLMNNLRLSPAELEAVRDQKLQAMIGHAYENVPYYRSLFQSVGLLPEDIRTVKDLQHNSLSTRRRVQVHGEAVFLWIAVLSDQPSSWQIGRRGEASEGSDRRHEIRSNN